MLDRISSGSGRTSWAPGERGRSEVVRFPQPVHSHPPQSTAVISTTGDACEVQEGRTRPYSSCRRAHAAGRPRVRRVGCRGALTHIIRNASSCCSCGRGERASRGCRQSIYAVGSQGHASCGSTYPLIWHAHICRSLCAAAADGAFMACRCGSASGSARSTT